MLPKEVAKLADDWWSARAKRLASKKKTDALEEIERALKGKLTAALEQEKITSIGGKKVLVTLKDVKKPAVGDWSKLYDYIRETDSFDLLQKRLLESAVAARWEEDQEVPGVYAMELKELSYSAKK